MTIEIKNRYTDVVLHTVNADTLSGVNLSYANLRFANLSGAGMSDARLSGADLRGADLSGADLRDANLSGANLSEADLRGANLRGVNLSGAKIDGLQIVTADQGEPLLRQVAEAALAAPKCLAMQTWHTCETSHCIAGWAIHLSGDKGRDLEKKYGPANAGMILLGVEASTHFYDDNETARKWLETIK